jgi:hypothetical protein
VGAGGAILPTERQVQRAILEMCGLCFPRVFIHHSPNGAFLGSARDKAIRGGALKGDGTKAGFPDLICFWSPAKVALIEVKRPKTGTLSDNQKAVHARLDDLRVPVATVSSIEEAYRFLFELGAPREREL